MTSSPFEAYQLNNLVQKLNNRGAQFIEAAKYDRATLALVKALRISERLAADTARTGVCRCRHCALDTCMSTSCTAANYNKQRPTDLSHQTIEYCGQAMSTDAKPHAAAALGDDSAGFIFCKPIYVTQESVQEGHYMGTTLSLIVIYNMALTHQLSALQKSPQQAPLREKLLQKAAHLYELAYRLQLDQGGQKDGEQVHSLRFSMVIANNLSEIYRLANNHSQHVVCLQHLLSSMMYLVDCQYPEDYIELEGFLQNTSHLVLQKVCANAA